MEFKKNAVLVIPIVTNPVDQKFPAVEYNRIAEYEALKFMESLNEIESDISVVIHECSDEYDNLQSISYNSNHSSRHNLSKCTTTDSRSIISVVQKYKEPFNDVRLSAIVNPCNFRLSEKGGLVNQAINTLCGSGKYCEPFSKQHYLMQNIIYCLIRITRQVSGSIFRYWSGIQSPAGIHHTTITIKPTARTGTNMTMTCTTTHF